MIKSHCLEMFPATLIYWLRWSFTLFDCRCIGGNNFIRLFLLSCSYFEADYLFLRVSGRDIVKWHWQHKERLHHQVLVGVRSTLYQRTEHGFPSCYWSSSSAGIGTMRMLRISYEALSFMKDLIFKSNAWLLS